MRLKFTPPRFLALTLGLVPMVVAPASALATSSPLTVAPALQAGADQAGESQGFRRTYTIHAESAWLGSGRILSPAYITLEKGVITRVSSREPQARKSLLGETKPKIIKVKGRLAPGIVDAWSGLLPMGVSMNRHRLPQSRVVDSLPVNLPGADPALSSIIASLRAAGVSAVYMGRADGELQRGMGVPVGFSAYDLPFASGEEILDLAVLGNPQSSQLRVQELSNLFQEAVDWKGSLDEYDDKIEKYEESLEKYQENLDKFVEKQKGKKTEGKDSQDAGAKDGKAEEPKKEEKRPKRPVRPKKPTSSASRDLILAALDGKSSVRIYAQGVAAIRAAIELQQKHDLRMSIIGGNQAVACRFKLAEAGIGVVLDLSKIDQKSDGLSLAEQFQQLIEAEVDVALSSGGRNLGPMLLTYAGELIAQGVDSEQVWAALTTTPARLLSQDKNYGQINRGFSGSLILFSGNSPFDASGTFRAHKPK